MSTPSWLRRHAQKIVTLLLWVLLIGVYQAYAWQNNLSPQAAVQTLINAIAGAMYGPLIYILVYALRPLLFFPATLLSLAGGFLYGPFWGVVYSNLGGNTSASVSYGVARLLGQSFLNAENSASLIQRYTTRLRQNSFETVLIMRFIFLPYDLVSYLCGFLHINWRSFALATFLGGLPGSISIASLGASVKGDFVNLNPSLDLGTLSLGIVMFIVSLALSRYFRRREATQPQESSSHEPATPR